MQRFLHHRAQQIGRLLESINALLREASRAAPSVGAELDLLLDTAAGTYANLGSRDVESRLLAMKAEWAAARRGIDPAGGAQLAGGRRALERGVLARLLQEVSLQLRTDHAKALQSIEEARALLVPVVLAAVQLHLLPADARCTPSDGSSVEALWRSICEHPELGIAAKRVALTIGQPDSVLLLADMLADLAPPARDYCRCEARPAAARVAAL